MNCKHLLWIVPLCLLVGMVGYSMLSVQEVKMLKPMIETCLAYETDMDHAVILLQLHCLKDLFGEQRNVAFCDVIKNLSKEPMSIYKFRT